MTTLPHTFKRIRLNLARSKEFPQGSTRHGYEFVAPLDDKGHIDEALWRQHRDNCRVRRFWEGEDDEIGFLVHRPGGPSTRAGCSTTTPSAPTTTRAATASAAHVFRQGEYVSISGADGEMHTYQVASVQDAT